MSSLGRLWDGATQRAREYGHVFIHGAFQPLLVRSDLFLVNRSQIARSRHRTLHSLISDSGELFLIRDEQSTKADQLSSPGRPNCPHETFLDPVVHSFPANANGCACAINADKIDSLLALRALGTRSWESYRVDSRICSTIA